LIARNAWGRVTPPPDAPEEGEPKDEQQPLAAWTCEYGKLSYDRPEDCQVKDDEGEPVELKHYEQYLEETYPIKDHENAE